VAPPADHELRLQRARLSLEGLSVGDAFGERYFFPEVPARQLIEARALIAEPWPWTDDTAMALSIFETLAHHGNVDRDALALAFAARYTREPFRGYGRMAADILNEIQLGKSWRTVATRPFNGRGSMGNGGAMRVAPVGAYFADDPDRVVAEARASAEVTHAHPEGQAGAIAVAVAAAFAWNVRERMTANAGRELIEGVRKCTPSGETRDGLDKLSDFPLDAPVGKAVELVGNGSRVTAPDTVPFAIWCAARHLSDYEEAMWTTVAGLGDRDTTCAIVGGIVVLSAGEGSIPAEWRRRREALPTISSATPR